MADTKWGGVRPGAGRPKKEKPKKMYSFRLSDEELEAVREVLAKMRNKVILLFCLFMIGLPTIAAPLKATVSYTEENARIEAFKGVSLWCPFPDVPTFQRSLYVTSINNNDILAIQEFNTKLFKIIPYKTFAVVYKDLPNFAYHYEKSPNGYRGMAVDVFITKDNSYPIKTIKYNAKTGKLMSIILSVSEDEDYVFDADKKPIGHWVKDKEVYNGEMTRKLIYSAQ